MESQEAHKQIPKAVAPWHDRYPAVKCSDITTLTRNELLGMMNSGALPGQDFLLVDLRRNDHEGGTIRGSINLPAQSLYSSLPTLYALVKAAKIPKVIWYCGSSRGRGSRAAGWFQDLLTEKKDHDITSLVLLEGIAGWVKGGAAYTTLMDDYDLEIWKV